MEAPMESVSHISVILSSALRGIKGDVPFVLSTNIITGASRIIRRVFLASGKPAFDSGREAVFQQACPDIFLCFFFRL